MARRIDFPKAAEVVAPATRILAGDIGGTKTNLAILRVVDDPHGDTIVVETNRRYPSTSHASLGAIIREFLGSLPSAPRLACAGFGVPGVVENGRAKPTNLAWAVDAEELEREFSIPKVELMNDLAANAYGIAELNAGDFAVIAEGQPAAEGNRCVVSPGTGLGMAGLYWDGARHHVWACEGGHCDFAPRTEVEAALFEYLQIQFGHVSAERVVSGMGIQNIYKFLRETGRGKELPEVAAAMLAEDPGKVISRFADAGKCPMCAETLEIFVACLAAEAGNMALKSMATGGVYLGGGVPVMLLDRLRGVGFAHAFCDKGRMRPLMESIPVRVVLNDQAALLGAARHAVDALL